MFQCRNFEEVQFIHFFVIVFFQLQDFISIFFFLSEKFTIVEVNDEHMSKLAR